ncbi:dimethylarginine dimethylaminohydrolase family protein [Dokdonella koreensis]|uniref:N-Dimethylarginine dimethylaminohydrolase n=1 Tax=Dokdonella koreensis DS-123 TaxID=1300342 RepID=A0A161HJ95_9GAMM|nr:arginine deiminase-related protein [Dokdonella koreensis]ANB16640.1 Putative N-Dimethylarginine dimethylaminohydrolase [Dokdonella koreensis DS-123]
MPPTARLLLCPPTYFEVGYVINPWMAGNLGQARPSRARAQWDALCELLAPHASLETIEPVAGLPDMPFTANAGLVHRDRFVPSRFRHAERRGEEARFIAWFAAQGFDVRPLPDGLAFEGAGDALFDRACDRLWFGHGHRTDPAAAEAVQALIGVETVPLRLVDPRYYHLDTCLCPLAGGWLLYYPAAFDAGSRAAIEARVPADRRLAVEEADAQAFACNAITLGRRVIVNRAGDRLCEALAAAGFATIQTPLDEFIKAGGSAKCLTLRLDEPPVD